MVSKLDMSLKIYESERVRFRALELKSYHSEMREKLLEAEVAAAAKAAQQQQEAAAAATKQATDAAAAYAAAKAQAAANEAARFAAAATKVAHQQTREIIQQRQFDRMMRFKRNAF